MWIVYALLSALFAALTTVFAKVGITGINSTLATAIRTVVVLAAAWGMVFITGTQRGINDITPRGWLFLALSGLATGASWLFYYKALQIGDTARVAAVDKFSIVLTMLLAFFILGDKPDIKTVLGVVTIAAGTLILVV